MADEVAARWSAVERERFLDRLVKSGSVAKAADAIGSTLGAAMRQRDGDPAFDAACGRAQLQFLDEVQAAVLRRVRDGSRRTVRTDKKAGTVVTREYSERLAISVVDAIGRRATDAAAASTGGAPPSLAAGEAARLAIEGQLSRLAERLDQAGE